MFPQLSCLALLATVVVSLPTTEKISIPLSKRSTVTNRATGVANITALRAAAASTRKKLQRNFEAYERNTGSPHRLAAGIKPSFHRKRQNEALTDFEEDLWFGSISVGTPAKTFTVDFDTGSSDTFLPSVGCDASCDGHTLWNTAESSTAVNTSAPYSLAFGDGSTVSGIVFTDTVTVAGKTAKAQAVGASTTYSTGFEIAAFPPDGLVGMGFPALSVFGENPLFTTLVNQGQVAGQFGVKLADSGSMLTLGGVDNALFKGTFTQVPVVEDAFWELALEDVSLSGKVLFPEGSGVASIADTGTTLLIGDTQDVEAVYSEIPGAKDASAEIGEGFFTVPCDAVPTIGLVFQGKNFNIPPTIFNAGQIEAGSADCVGGLMADDLGFWVVGDIFLRSVYTSFDATTNTVGFAQLA